MTDDQSDQWLDVTFAVFNCHRNDAAAKAKEAFVAKYGEAQFDRRIGPILKAGIMSVFNDRNEWTMFYVDQIHAAVNEGIPKPVEE